MKILGEMKTGKLGLDELFVTGLSKYAGERLSAPIIGNGTLQSGAIKIVSAVVGNHFVGEHKYGKAVALGVGVDGIEDVLNAVLGGMSGGNSSPSVI